MRIFTEVVAQHRSRIRLTVWFALVGTTLLLSNSPAFAASTINFQGKLTNPDGTNLTNGNYTIRFRVYEDPVADAAVACNPTTTTCQWEESQIVSVTDGNFQVELGSVTSLIGAIDFANPNLFLAVQVGSDPEMSPRITFTAAPYAFNSQQLGGMSASGFVQLGNGLQSDASANNASIGINKTAAGDLLDLQHAGNRAILITNDGSALLYDTSGTVNLLLTQLPGQSLPAMVH
jgi:hypothetical protein